MSGLSGFISSGTPYSPKSREYTESHVAPAFVVRRMRSASGALPPAAASHMLVSLGEIRNALILVMLEGNVAAGRQESPSSPLR